MDENLEWKIDRIIEKGYSFSIKDYVGRGFALYKSSANAMIPFSLLYFLVVMLTSRIMALSIVVNVFISPCVIAGFYLAANKAMQGAVPMFSDCLDGFKMFVEIVVINLVVNILASLGLICLVLPGIYLYVAYTFASMFVIFLKADYRTALRLSRKLIHCNWWTMFGLLAVALLIGISGALLFGIGMIFTLPIMHCILYIAFEDIVGRAVK